jgi:hypothetical protein
MRSQFQASGTPVTYIIIAGNVLTFLASFVGMGSGFSPMFLAASSLTFPMLPITAVTWPLVSTTDPIGLFFGVMWALWVCGSLERSWGSQVFAWFVVALSAITTLACWGLGALLHAPFGLAGLWMGLAAPTVAWCYINRREKVSIYFIFKIPAPWLGAITVASFVYQIAVTGGSPIMGIAGLVSPALAYWYASGARLTLGKARSKSRFDGFENEVRDAESGNPIARLLDGIRRKQRDAKIKKMFKNSGLGDDDKD